ILLEFRCLVQKGILTRPRGGDNARNPSGLCAVWYPYRHVEPTATVRRHETLGLEKPQHVGHQASAMMIESTLERILLATRTAPQIDFLQNCHEHLGSERQIHATNCACGFGSHRESIKLTCVIEYARWKIPR